MSNCTPYQITLERQRNPAVGESITFILIANGKEEILKKAFSGEIDPRVPASILQLHCDVTIIHSPV